MRRSKRIIPVLVATLVAVSVNVAAQAAQAPQNESVWQKIKKSAKQTGQNAAQQLASVTVVAPTAMAADALATAAFVLAVSTRSNDSFIRCSIRASRTTSL